MRGFPAPQELPPDRDVAEWSRITGDTQNCGVIYQISATHDPKATDDQVRLMIQSLLKDRFKMVVHRATRNVTGYALTVARGGPTMQETQEGKVPELPDWMLRPPGDPANMEGTSCPRKGSAPSLAAAALCYCRKLCSGCQAPQLSIRQVSVQHTISRFGMLPSSVIAPNRL